MSRQHNRHNREAGKLKRQRGAIAQRNLGAQKRQARQATKAPAPTSEPAETGAQR